MENNFNNEQNNTETQGSVVRGVIGAVLGALIGAAIWCVVAIGTEKIWSLIGLAIGFIVGFGYDLLKGRKGTIRMVVVLVCVIVSVVGGTIAAHGWWLHEAYVEESEFIATASKQELAEVYLSEEELAELNSYPETIKQRALSTLEVTMPDEAEYYRMFLNDSEFLSAVGGECVSSIFFGLLGSFALILNNGKKEKAATTNVDSASVSFDEAAVNLATVPAQEEGAEDKSDQEVQA